MHCRNSQIPSILMLLLSRKLRNTWPFFMFTGCFSYSVNKLFTPHISNEILNGTLWPFLLNKTTILQLPLSMIIESKIKTVEWVYWTLNEIFIISLVLQLSCSPLNTTTFQATNYSFKQIKFFNSCYYENYKFSLPLHANTINCPLKINEIGTNNNNFYS